MEAVIEGRVFEEIDRLYRLSLAIDHMRETVCKRGPYYVRSNGDLLDVRTLELLLCNTCFAAAGNMDYIGLKLSEIALREYGALKAAFGHSASHRAGKARG